MFMFVVIVVSEAKISSSVRVCSLLLSLGFPSNSYLGSEASSSFSCNSPLLYMRPTDVVVRLIVGAIL